MLRGINRQDIFEERQDYQQFLNRLQYLVDPIDDNGEHIPSYCHVYAYCLMSNHVHLLIREHTESISVSLKRLSVFLCSILQQALSFVSICEVIGS